MFKSRWKALFWAMGVLVTAYCTVPGADETSHQQTAGSAAQPAHHKSPWAKN